MRKRYVAPNADIVLLETEQNIMDEDWGSKGDIWEPGAYTPGYSTFGTGGTVVNNNGAPTFVPGGNGGGGRQTPLG